ncbi:membrane protein of ER body-like protein [Abrus precatorius]|uniref:Membrane protein of ER body-like protein n=1 Tax=Abrus precatorius TaxID=3816 RepID=A0A8B8K002_ABRPR|nr:membrane protein of ER body-like protein [Abrus precatorius]
MEVMVNQWNEAIKEVEEVAFQRKRSLQHSISSSSSNSNSSDSNDSNKDMDPKGGVLEFEESETKEKSYIITTERNAEMILQHEDTENGIILPASDPPLPEDSAALNNVASEIARVGTVQENGQERQELYLENVFQKPPTHGFYCPNCKSCIQKVYIQKGEWEQTNAPTQPLQPTEPIRCSSCFSFLIPIGGWLFPGWVSDGGEANDQVTGSSNNNTQPEDSVPKIKGVSEYEASEPNQSEELVDQSVALGTSKLGISIANGNEKQNLQIIEEVHLRGPGPQKVASEGQVAPKKGHFWSSWAVIGSASEAPIPTQPETSSLNSDWRVITATSQFTIPNQPEFGIPDKKEPEHIQVKIDEVYTGPIEQVVAPAESTPLLPRREPPAPASNKTWEILKSIVYGGLNESLASLSVVTSAASADATTLNIVALAIANLIGGLFVLGHNLGELKAENPKRAENSTEEAVVDRYNELLGQRENFFLHAFVAILSFIVFGLVPPVVYGFSFLESDDKDFKLAAVAGASLLCITMLSIGKAYIKRPNSYLTYFQTVLYYVTTGAVASVLSYLAGDLVKTLVEKLGWFESTPPFALQIPRINVPQPGSGSY